MKKTNSNTLLQKVFVRLILKYISVFFFFKVVCGWFAPHEGYYEYLKIDMGQLMLMFVMKKKL